MSKYAVMPLSDYVDTCDTIRNYTRGTLTISSHSLPEEIRDVYNRGINEGYDTGYALGKRKGKNEAYSEINQDNTRLENAIFATNVENAQNSLTDNVTTTSENFELIKSKIVSKGVEVAEGTLTADYAPKIDEVYEAGRKSQYDEFWDNFQNYGNRESYICAFRLWNDTMFKPKYDIKPTGQYGAEQMFYQTEIVDIGGCLKKQGVSIDFSNAIRLNSTFDRTAAATSIPPIDATSCTSMIRTFFSSQKTKSIEINNLKEECTFDKVFDYDYGLENLTIEGTIGQNGLNLQWSTKLSKASWVSIVGCYSTTISGLSMTGSLASVNSAFETSKGANDGSTSAEWLNLIATRPNVSFNLL